MAVRGIAGGAKQLAPQWAKESVAPALRTWGRLTASHRALPDFLIVGTKRGGTTTLLKYLQLHPGVLRMWPEAQNSKKTWFFDDNHARGEAWYRGFFATDAMRARRERELGYRPVTGEAAPYYLFHPLVPQRVAETMPEGRVIVLLRNPVDRAHSHWNERRNAGVEKLSFRDAIEAEPERLAGQHDLLAADAVRRSDAHDHFSYLERGDYLPQLRRWLDAMPADQLLVLRSEDLYSDAAATLREVHRFLGLPPGDPPAPHRYNRLPAEPLDAAMRARLSVHFAPRVAELEAFLGRGFGWRLDDDVHGRDAKDE